MDDEVAEERLRRHFEAQFGSIAEELAPAPAPALPPAPSEEMQTEEQEQEPERGGEAERAREGPRVFTYQEAKGGVSGAQARRYMTAKIPKIAHRAPQPARPDADDDDEPGEDVTNLQNDIALQKLLRESALLEHGAGGELKPAGKSMLKATSRHLEMLGARAPTPKMPMNMRKGIDKKKQAKHELIKASAREASIVLARDKAPDKPSRPRDRGLREMTIGKFRKGKLELSARDIRRVQAGENAARPPSRPPSRRRR